MEKLIVAFAGPSGAGKSELANLLLKAHPEVCTRWRQFTTRARRHLQEEYVFLDDARYEAIADLLTCRTHFGGNNYGTLPEEVGAEAVVLTIVDVAGLSDLREDVARHNTDLDETGRGKFGSSPVRLLQVLVHYDVNDDSIERRGRKSRGTESIQKELERLLRLFQWDDSVDTTSAWPDPAHFFQTVIEPAISARSRQSVASGIWKLVSEIEESQLDTVSDANLVAAQKLLQQATALLLPTPTPSSDARDADMVDSILSHTDMGGDAHSGELEVTTEYLNDRVTDPLQSESGPTDDKATESPQSDGETPSDEDSAARPPEISDLITASFEPWLLENGIGAKAFNSIEAFTAAILDFLGDASVRVKESDLSVTRSMEESDSGPVVRFCGIFDSGASFEIVYSDRLRRIVGIMGEG
jgi:hypothetical protein